MTSAEKKRFLSEWAETAATVVLTRRPELTIAEANPDTGFDLEVSIKRNDRATRPSFGVLLRAEIQSLDVHHANKLLTPTLTRFQAVWKPTSPICLFLFTMRERQEYLTWLAEPVIKDGVPKLIRRKSALCVPVTNDLLAEIVDRVVAWYDAVEAVLIE